MKTECLLVILVMVAMTEGRKSKCQKEKEADPDNGPECLDNGKYNPRQCNDTVCWCVDKRSGNPLYDDVKIPVTHRYKCGKEPRGCLKKELDLRMKGITDELKIPLCNKKGYYKPKQCEAVPKRKCRKQERKKRQLGESCYNGKFAEAHNGFLNLTGSVSVDSTLQWTFVPKSDYVTIDGEVTTIEVNVGAVDRTVKFGVYAPCPVTCQFRLLQHFVWTSPSLGFHVITLGVGERLTVKTGYFLGISWENYGVVEWHTVGTQNYCEDSLTFSPGDSVTLYADRHGNREYDVRYTIEGSTQTKFGFDPIDRDKVDTGMEWTFVNKAPFPNAGRIVALEFWVGGENRELRFGLYRPTSGVFEVVRQLVYPAGFPLGFNQVVLSGADIIDVEGGDNFGFTWTNKGVIDYDTSTFTNYFYHINAAYNEGDPTGTLTDIHGKRIYSIQVCFETCKNTTLPEKDGPCNATTFGLSGLTADKVDTAAVWTFVQTTPVSREGEVTAIEVNVGAVNRTVKFGVYEPCPYTCQFKLVAEFLWKSSSLGFTVIDIPLGVRCKVKEGFHLGFSWIGYGVIKYENVDEFNYCEDGLTFSEGDTATLVENRYGNRAYDVRFTIESLALWVGYPSIDRDNVDTSSGWTFVLKNNPFPSDGQIVAFEFYVGRANTTIQFGLYRGTGTAGEFTVIKKLEYASGFPLGHNRVELAGDDIICVEQGDSLGISWPDLGVIDWAPPPPPLTSEYYYYANAIYAEGNTTGTMSDATPISNRCYSFRAEFVCCDKSAPLGAEGQCVQCFCVDKDGTEQEGTRTTEIGDLKCKKRKG